MGRMLNAIGAYLKESNGVKSFIRFGSAVTIFVSLLWGTVEVTVAIFVKDHTIHTELILGALTIGFGGKVLQKKHESNERNPEDQG